MLKPSLQLKLGQQLTMTPQLQQAIRLLQLPALELQAHIRELLETNVMLEPTEEAEGTGTFEATEPTSPDREHDHRLVRSGRNPTYRTTSHLTPLTSTANCSTASATCTSAATRKKR